MVQCSNSQLIGADVSIKVRLCYFADNQSCLKPVSYHIDDLMCSWMDCFHKVDVKKPSSSGPTKKGGFGRSELRRIIAGSLHKIRSIRVKAIAVTLPLYLRYH